MADSQGPGSFPLGVDLVEMKKAKVLYQNHRDHLDSFFNPQEISQIRKAAKPHEKMAALLAAKEAIFKALPTTSIGLLNFRDISLSATALKKLGLEVIVVRKKNYVVATCEAASTGAQASKHPVMG